MKTFQKSMAVLAAAVLLILSMSVSALAAQAPTGNYQTTALVNLRSGPSTGYSITTGVKKGDTVQVSNTSNPDWYKVSYTNSKKQTYRGYISSKYLKLTGKSNTKPAPKQTKKAATKQTTKPATGQTTKRAVAPTGYYEAISEVNLRSGAGTNYSIVASVPGGDVVYVTSTENETWYQVKYTNSDQQTYQGYISSKYLKITAKRENKKKAATGAYAVRYNLSIHKNASTSSSVSTTVPKGNVVQVTDTSNEYWYKVVFINSSGKKYTGFLSSGGLSKAAEPYDVKAQAKLYTKASSSSKVKVTVPKGSHLHVTAVYSKTWYKVSYTTAQGTTYTGYIKSSCLKKGTVTNQPQKQVDPEEELWKQDELWLTSPRYVLESKQVLRGSASKSGKKLATLSKNTVVAVTSTSKKNWYKVLYQNDGGKKVSGYLPESSLSKYKESKGGYYVVTVSASLRHTDSETGKVVVKLPKHSRVMVTVAADEDWYIAEYTNSSGATYQGFIPADYLTKYEEKNGGPFLTVVRTPLRAAANETGKVVAKLPKHSRVMVTDTYNPDWYQVSYIDENGENHTGFVYTEHLERYEEQNAGEYITLAATPMRTTASETGSVAVTVPQETIVTVTSSFYEDWYEGSYTDASGTTYHGFVYKEHLTPVPVEEPVQEEDPSQTEPEDQSVDQSSADDSGYASESLPEDTSAA